MKSRTLSSDLTIIRKDLSRAAPAWLGLLCILLIITYTSGLILNTPQAVDETSLTLATFFAPLIAMILLGYLTRSDECCAVHALPIRRERLLVLHTVAAFLAYILPMVVYIVLTGSEYQESPLTRLLWTAVEFVFLFSISLFCMLCTGRKLGAALLYILIFIFPYLLGSILDTVYITRLPGVLLPSDYYETTPASLLWEGRSYASLVDLELHVLVNCIIISLSIYAICFVIYRRRQLEHAGDLVSVKWMNPIFATIAAYVSAVLLHNIVTTYQNEPIAIPTLFAGLALGYFFYHMLVNRSARIFTKRILIGFALLLTFALGSVYVTELDPLDRANHIPETDEIASVRVSQYKYAWEDYLAETPESIESVRRLHEKILANHQPDTGDPVDGKSVYLRYQLQNGQLLHREYIISDETLIRMTEFYLSQPYALFQVEDPQFVNISVRHDRLNNLHPVGNPDYKEFEKIFLAECQAGKMFSYDYQNHSDWSVTITTDENPHGIYISIPIAAVNTITWLEANYTN